jgi:hypothetical protein
MDRSCFVLPLHSASTTSSFEAACTRFAGKWSAPERPVVLNPTSWTARVCPDTHPVQDLRTLARHPGKLLTHREICEDVWGPRYHGTANLLHVHVWHPRQKIEREPSRPRRIITEHGLGFRLIDETEAALSIA